MKQKKPIPRITWGFNPVTRTVKSKKCYSRKGAKNPLLGDL